MKHIDQTGPRSEVRHFHTGADLPRFSHSSGAPKAKTRGWTSMTHRQTQRQSQDRPGKAICNIYYIYICDVCVYFYIEDHHA